MTAKQRIKQLEKNTNKQAADMPTFQSKRAGVIHVHWLSGRVTIEPELMRDTKTYFDVCPCEWDEPKADE